MQCPDVIRLSQEVTPFLLALLCVSCVLLAREVGALLGHTHGRPSLAPKPRRDGRGETVGPITGGAKGATYA